MKKIGILLGSTDCTKYLYDTVSQLAKSNLVELFFLLNATDSIQKTLWQKITYKLKTKTTFGSIELNIFRVLITLEHKILSACYRDEDRRKAFEEHNRVFNISEFNKNDIVYLTPMFSASGPIVHYNDEDIKKVESLKLDIIIRGNASGMLKGGIIKSAKDGIISFHHGDNRWNRGDPPGFWEVYLRKPSTGFVIQILTEEPNVGKVIFRGEIATACPFTKNVVQLYRESNPYLAKIVLDYAKNGQLPAPEESIPFGQPLLGAPSLAQSIKYFFVAGCLFLSKGINYLFCREERWGIAFFAGSWRNAILATGMKIKDPPNHFLADPFVITKNGTTICYVEDYSYDQKKACITAIQILDPMHYRILGPVIEEPFHMSFPFLFEYQQELFMVPETSASNSIRLYKCVEYPLKWEYQRDILSNCRASDTVILRFRGKWWLLTNLATEGNSDHNSQLFAYYNDHPLSNDWIPHDLNPIVFNSNIGRNGGILDIDSEFPVRVRQKQNCDTYGYALTLARITDLTPSSFNEEEIGRIYPNFFKGITRCHHIHSDGTYTVYDYANIAATIKLSNYPARFRFTQIASTHESVR